METISEDKLNTLKRNKDLAILHAKKVIQGGTNFVAPSTGTLKKSLDESLVANNFSKAIATLSQLKDERSNIHTYISMRQSCPRCNHGCGKCSTS